jgi:tRNA pseudouridine55 synthase
MFYIVDKPLKVSSNLVAKILKRVLDVSKIGFAGTLDPLATGLMIIGTDGSPRLFPFIEHLPKTYRTTIRLDGTTSSFDLEQPIEQVDMDEGGRNALTKERIEEIFQKHFTGEIMQVPPMYSAVWIDGKRAYDLARKGHDVVIEAKKRTIHKAHIVSYVWPTLIVEMTVSHGTYIRSIARDLGALLWTGWYLERLERISIGHINLDDLVWTQHNDIRYSPLPHKELFPEIPFIQLTEEEKIHIRLGSTPLKTGEKNGHYFVVYQDNTYGLLEAKEGLLFPLKNAV